MNVCIFYLMTNGEPAVCKLGDDPPFTLVCQTRDVLITVGMTHVVIHAESLEHTNALPV